jgi:prepilin-type N-terminal cleavage/methylation domain-containing protein
MSMTDGARQHANLGRLTALNMRRLPKRVVNMMQLKEHRSPSPNSTDAFTIIELLVGILVLGVVFVGLYLGIAQGFAVIQLARENLRATQILQEKMETIRLYRWDRINNPEYIPSAFSEPFYAVESDGNNSGLIYNGQVTITNVNLDASSYSPDVREVMVEVTWVSGNVQRRREMRTLISRFGLQRYVY